MKPLLWLLPNKWNHCCRPYPKWLHHRNLHHRRCNNKKLPQEGRWCNGILFLQNGDCSVLQHSYYSAICYTCLAHTAQNDASKYESAESCFGNVGIRLTKQRKLDVMACILNSNNEELGVILVFGEQLVSIFQFSFKVGRGEQ
jgi:hypothetical protein